MFALLRTSVKSGGNAKNRAPQEDGEYLFTNLAEYNDLMPGRKIVKEALKKAGK